MSLPITNTTCDIYRNSTAPGNPPDVTGVPCLLQPDYAQGRAIVFSDPTKAWTHVLLVALTIDIRDGFSAGVPLQAGDYDRVYVPDRTGTEFSVVFVERLGRGTIPECKRVYLRREKPTYPTNEV